MAQEESGTFLEMFLRQVAATPSNAAVETADQRLTYAALDDASARLAARLHAEGVGQGSIVGVCLEPSLDLVVSVLSVIRAGAAWLPLDPSYPEDRLAYMVSDSGTRLLLADGTAAPWLDTCGVPVLHPADATEEAPVPPAEAAAPESAAYVIYTSGSTGRPKGVTLTHRGLANLARAQVATYGLAPGKRVLQFASPSFDASVFELTMALLSGATLVLPPRRDVLYGPGLGEFLREARISHITLPPSVLGMVPRTELPDLEVITCAGEALPPHLVERWAPGRRLLNAYGPTEATVWASYAEAVPDGGKPDIGHAIDGVHLYVLDEDMQPVPDGEDGELAIGGPGVARGYIGRPGLTADRFVPDPERPGRRVYRTGDLVRRGPGGALDFLGRIDQQVKLHGFRIELDEIAAVLGRHPDVQDTAVVVGEVGDQEGLLAYVVAPGANPVDLRDFTRERLPHYMVPTVVTIDRLPLTPNGKLDRAALPAPDRASLGLAGAADDGAARTPTEQRLAAMVAELLGMPDVSVHDDFFTLGGHSLYAGRLAALIRAEFSAEFPISAIYQGPTVAAMAQTLDDPGAVAPALPPLRKADREGPLPLSFPQERIWFLEQLSPGNLAYNAQAALEFRGPLDADALHRTLTEIVRRHEVMRTAFAAVDGTPVQQPLPPMPVHLPVTDLTGQPAGEQERRMQEVLRATMQQPFELTAPPLVRWALVRHAADRHTLVQVEHHFVHDGWSFGRLLDEIRAIYTAFAAGEPSPLPEPPIQYADFAVWQRDWLSGEVLQRHIDHWKKHLDGAPLTLDLPTDRPRPRNQSFSGAALRVELPAALSHALEETSRRAGVTLFSSMLSGFASLMGRYAQVDDVVIGTGVANRRLAEIEGMLGMVVNTLPLHIDMSGTPGFDALRTRVHDVVIGSSDWQDVPLDRLVESIAPPRDPSRNPLFQVMFSFHNASVPDLDFGGVEGTVREQHNGTAKMDLNIVVIPRSQQRTGLAERPGGDTITLIWEYSTALFDEDTMRRMVDHYIRLLETALAEPERPVDHIDLVSAGEADVIEAFNRTAGEFPDASLHGLVDAQAARTPDAVAVVGADGERVTYADLVGRANAVAHSLVGEGVGPDVPVGLWMDRSVEMLVALLGILKAGGAYVPLDPDVPPARAVTVLSEGGIRFVCADADRAGHFADSGVRAVVCEGLTESAPEAPELGLLPDHLVSVYFTSGSTGRPKGVASTHRGWVNRMWWMQEHYGISPGETVLHKTILSFDDSAVELFWPLITGATVVMLGAGLHRDPRAILEAATRHRIAVLHFVPSMLTLFLDELGPEACTDLAHLRHVVSSGEALPPRTVQRFHERLGRSPARLYNQWGATEVSIDSTAHTCLPQDADRGAVPLGAPITNNELLVLDDHLNPTPVGIPGNLHLAGTGLARGYFDDPRKTASAFLPHPHDPGQRLYDTGDQGIRHPDGTITFLGRSDHQIKVRGIRIEPGEIEHALRAHPAVAEAIVTKWEPTPGDQRLAAYLILADPAADIDSLTKDLETDLLAKLPPYLVPTSYTPIDAVPTNANGKLDAKRLPAPRTTHTTRAHTPPATDTEHLIADIWADVLQIRNPDVHSNFFTLGGHSLLATRAISRLRQALGLNIPLALLFDHPTIHTMAQAVEDVLLKDLDQQAGTGRHDPLPAVEGSRS